MHTAHEREMETGELWSYVSELGLDAVSEQLVIDRRALAAALRGERGLDHERVLALRCGIDLRDMPDAEELE